MEYRKFGNLDWQVSALGFGCMRLPTVDENPMSGNIKEDEATKMVRYAIDNGVNYVDTAYFYHQGNSEVFLGQALKDGYREKVRLATKSPVMLINEAEDFEKFLDEQLNRLQTDHIDFYLFHGLSKKTWNIVEKFDLLNKAESAMKAGKIGHIGFSFHDNYDAFNEIINGYDGWSFCQIQYNYMDTENQAGIKGLKLAASKGLAVIVMEPLLGGKLANPPKSIKEGFEVYEKKRTPADWALQWIWNQPEVSLVLSGMSSMKQVEDNLQSANISKVNSFSKAENEFIKNITQKYRERTAIPCTGCSYCMPCPNDVEIPKNFKIYNDGFMHDDIKTAQHFYSRFLEENKRASTCTQCKLCEEKCPQKILISEWMPKVHKALK